MIYNILIYSLFDKLLSDIVNEFMIENLTLYFLYVLYFHDL